MEQKQPAALVFLDNEAFFKLSYQEKLAYLQKAMDAVKSGTPIVTSNIKDVPGTPDYLKK
jgi:hypothetical protein